MRKIWIYLLGVLTGAIVTIIVLAVIGMTTYKENNPSPRTINGMTLFEEPGDIVEPSSVKVFQTLETGTALANCKGEHYGFYGDPVVLLYNEDGNSFYDDQVINAPKGKCFRQIGIYKYSSRNGNKTVPIVKILDK